MTTPPVTDYVDPIGSIRRSQMISTYGIGGVVDLEKGSFMPLGLDDLDSATRLPSLSIREPRLEAMLGVSGFRLGPAEEKERGGSRVNARRTAPAVRFPEWHECPRCHRLGEENAPFDTSADGSRLVCTACGGGSAFANPVRFVTACRNGHIDNFPWVWWAHRDREAGDCDRPALYLRSHGRSAALADLYVECLGCQTDGKPTRRSLGDAFGEEALAGGRCLGRRPWLGDREADCESRSRVLQRGASNVHFPVVCSSLSIPPASEAIMLILAEMATLLEAVPPEALAGTLQGLASNWDLPVESVAAAWRRMNSDGALYQGLTEKIARAEEYAALGESRHDPVVAGVTPEFENTVAAAPAPLSPWFDLVGGVSRLREVRALAGFSRIDPYPVSAERVREALGRGLIAPLSRNWKPWLPAAEIRGEGLFLRFRTEAVDAWIASNPAFISRAGDLDLRGGRAAADRGIERDYSVTPRLLLVHSFAHALVRQISIECGYSASALRERLYVAEEDDPSGAMNGVLIYTGSADSEGSLGGLVRLASPELLTPIFLRALSAAGWCGSDPVCLETEPSQAGERISGAACHCCLLLPETACEKFNRELDRVALVGSRDLGVTGYFENGATV